MEAVHLRDNLGALGTCGWMGGRAWTVQYIRARSAEEALRKAK